MPQDDNIFVLRFYDNEVTPESFSMKELGQLLISLEEGIKSIIESKYPEVEESDVCLSLVDVENKKLVPALDVLIENGVITAVGKKLSAASPQIIDGSGKYLMPGLVDAHVHFFQSGSIYTRHDAIDLRKVKPYEEEIQWAHNNMDNFLRRYLSAGITSTVDVGATVSFLKQRDSFRTKAYAPSVYMTGPLLGNARAGGIAAWTSNTVSIFSGGVLCVIGVLACIVILPAFFRYERPTSEPVGDPLAAQ